MLYSKNGSIPSIATDGTEGWIEVSDAPTASEGQEVIWCFPPGWVVRDVMPATRDGYRWMHYLDLGWVEYQIDTITTEQVQSLTSDQIQSLTTDQI